ncbi:hypothetical protein [Undibacterium sp.]|uniref:hypothetical protein n=1 Tax=Undibacterium sp. TaxID=1914977 RepID=UPI00273008AF|nr:hypothetical protein [Undibacterium sp.]MDP1977212.1 hypothetical protein [Undibacterium sp.]
MFVLALRLLPVCDRKRITLHIVLTILIAKQQTGKSFRALTGVMGMCACAAHDTSMMSMLINLEQDKPQGILETNE